MAKREIVLRLIFFAVIGLLFRDTSSDPPLLKFKIPQSLRYVRFPIARGEGCVLLMLLHETADLRCHLALVQ